MPLINCLECNAIISDQAPSCPHCGIPQGKNLASIQCPECDSKISPQASSCPQCGIPLKKLSVSHSPSMPVGDDVKAIASIFSLAFFFSSQGRISRLQYALAIGCLIAVAILENLLLLQMLDSNAVFAIILNVLFAIPLFISFILVAIKRCHDINWSGWNSIGLFIPYLGFLMLAFLLFIKGDEENNQYGNSPYSLLKTLNHANNTTKNDTPPHSNWMNPEEDK